ncbi:hypothetical protein COO72_07670 [Bifidobacterium callitrichos]|nr:hypothetical protein COO72_07670 [Bifidobacterium callitrichos]
MKPQLGDTLFNRYTLVALLRDEPGVQAWKANDRVLAQDCQLFVLTAPDTLESVSSLASQSGLKDGMTPVLQFRKAGDAAVLVTKLETGLSLTEYLRGKARGTFSYEAMRSVIGDAATIVSGIEDPRLSTDTIRIAVTGVEITDVPLTPLLAEPSGAPDGMPAEQLAIRQLAAVLYGMLKRKPVTPDTEYDLTSLDADMPTEFHVILSRGLELPNANTGKRGEPMLTLGELTALLGEWTPLDQLSDRDLALPTDAGEGSISTVAVRDLSKSKLVELPASDVTTERLPELNIHRAPSEQEAARHADAVVAAQNAESFADMEESFKQYSPHDFFAMGRNVPPKERARIAAQSYIAPAGSGAGAGSGVAGDAAAAGSGVGAGAASGTGAQGSGSGSGSGVGTSTNALGHASQYRTEDLVNDFSFQVYPAPVALPDDMNTGEQTSRIPIITDSNMPTVAIDMRDPEHMAIEGFEDFVNPHEDDGEYAGDGHGRGNGRGRGSRDGRGHGNERGISRVTDHGQANSANAVNGNGPHAGVNTGSNGTPAQSQSQGQQAGVAGVADHTNAHPDPGAANGSGMAAGQQGDASQGATTGHETNAKNGNAPHAASSAGAGTYGGTGTNGHGGAAPAGNGQVNAHVNEHIAPGSMPPAIPVSPALPPRPVAPDFDMNHPPSFKPKSMLDRDPADDAHEDLSDKHLLGKMTTATVALIVAALVLVVLLAGALVLFLTTSTNPADHNLDKNNQWPDDSNVPFGDDQNGDGSSDGTTTQQSGDQSATTSADGSDDDGSDVILIDVTDTYFR